MTETTHKFCAQKYNHEQPVSSPYDHTVEDCVLTVEKWKELIYKEVVAYDTIE